MQIVVRESLGVRELDAPLAIAGRDAQVLVPGVPAGERLELFEMDGSWWLRTGAAASTRLNGQPVSGERELAAEDVIAFGAAQLVFRLQHGAASLDVIHLAGNDTVAPLALTAPASVEVDAGEVEIRAAGLPAAPAGSRPVASAARPAFKPLWLLAAAVPLALAALLFAVVAVPLQLSPSTAHLAVPGSLHWRAGDRLFLLPGTHAIRATQAGYRPAAVSLQLQRDAVQPLQLALEALPGRLAIDTQGVSAEVFVDGAPAGRAPGEIEVAAGSRLIVLRADRHLDFLSQQQIEGRGTRQSLVAALKPAWGTLRIASSPAAARVEIDGKELGSTPASFELDAGLRDVLLTATGHKPWRSRVAIAAGETLALGPIDLGAPEAELDLRSTPAGAAISIDGAFRGNSPARLKLAAGAPHEVTVTLAGYRVWTERMTPGAGERRSIVAQLAPVLVKLIVRGEPEAAKILIDGEPRGSAPLLLALTATTHQITVQAERFGDWSTSVAMAEGQERQVDYRLLPAGRSQALAQQIRSRYAGVLQLLPAGAFIQGSDRREQGRRPNETQRRVTLTHDFYLGVLEVSNAQFHAFRASHVAGIVGSQTLDLDNYPVTGVSWDDAAEFCNWLSQQEGLPLAYERRDGRLQPVAPANTGYRLPTEAEWEYAARYTNGKAFRRFAWGDELPPPAGAANIAGDETQPGTGKRANALRTADAAFPGYSDEHAVLAPVGSYGATPLGLKDMAGNVSEWTQDVYSSFLEAVPVSDPAGPAVAGAHAIRGSSWRSATVPELRLAWRDSAAAASQTIGFRVARNAEVPSP